MHAAAILLLFTLPLWVQPSNTRAAALIEQYVKVIGGESALRAVQTRITEGGSTTTAG
jgi:hypothetical protein